MFRALTRTLYVPKQSGPNIEEPSCIIKLPSEIRMIDAKEKWLISVIRQECTFYEDEKIFILFCHHFFFLGGD